ncbi:MAG: methionine aminotransferase [Bacteroidota bacterium]
MPKLQSKLPEVGATIFTVMSQMAAKYGAINLSQGFPDFAVSKDLINLIADAMTSGKNQYAPMSGLPALKESISEMTSLRYGYTPSPESEVTVTAGATEALFASIMAVVQPGNEVIVFDPGYDSYAPAIAMAGGAPIHINLKYPNYHIDWDEVANRITERTRLIIINTPHNPTGSVFSKNDIEALQTLAERHDLVVLSDEVYEHIIFDGKVHQSVLNNIGLRSRSIAVSSFGKTFHATGWKVGYLIAPNALTHEIRKVHQFLTFSVHTPTQVGLATFLREARNYEGLSKMYESKRNFFLSGIESSRFIPVQSSGAYFQLLDYSNISEEKDVDMASRMTKEYCLASIPVSVFYNDNTDNKVLRFCFAKREDTLSRAAEILCKI